MGVTLWLAWPACGGQSIRYEEDPDETSGVGGTGFGANTGGGVAGTNGFGGSSPSGGVGDFPNGGDGIGAVPTGGSGAQGGVGPAGTGFGGVGASGAGNAGLGGVSGVFGTGGFDGGGVGGRGRGMGGRFGGGRFGGRGMAGRGAGGGGMGGFSPNPLDGFTFRTACGSGVMMGPTCPLSATCANPEPSLPGFHATDTVVTMPGTLGVFYDVTIHVQGVVESKTYSGGFDQDGYLPIVPADGFYSGGAPAATSASIYLVRVASPAHDYYLNSISPPTMSSVAPPATVDYRGVIRVEGGTTVRLVSADGDCSILRNCGATMSSTDCNPVTLALLPGIADDVPMQPYNGQFLGMVVDSVAAL